MNRVTVAGEVVGESLALYETAAQVIPLLFIVLLVELRLFDIFTDSDKGKARSVWDAVILALSGMSVIGAAVVSEWMALAVLNSGQATPSARAWVIGGLGALGIWVVIVPLRQILRFTGNLLPEGVETRIRAIGSFLAVAGAFGLLIYAILSGR